MSHRRFLLSTVLLAATLLGCLSTTTPQVFTPTPAAGQLLSEQSQVFFQKTGQRAEEVMVNDDRMSSTGDEIWTQAQGRALLRFPDLWVRIYDDTVLHTEEVTPSGIKLAMGSGAVLIGETPRSLEDVTIVLGSPPRARIILAGTLVMIAYIPSEQVVLVRAFDGKADVSVVATGRTARADSDSAEWLIVGPENQLETPSQDDVRALARRVGFWDVYHEIELDAAGFGPPGASIPAEDVALTFVGTPTPASTAQACRPGVLYCEDFDDGDAQGWKLRAGSQVEQEGVNNVLAMSGFQGLDYLRDHTWQDHRFSLRFKLAQPASHIVAHYRYDADTGASYAIVFSPDTLLLAKSGEGPGVLSSIKTQVTLDRWHQAEIAGWGGRIQVTLDDKVVMDVIDPLPLLQGTIGLSPFLGDPDALVDDIEVMPTGSEPLQSPPPTEPPALAPPTEPPPPSPEIHCQPKNTTIELGECIELSWAIRNAKAVYLNDAPVNSRDNRKECPVASSVYSLRIETGKGDRYCDMKVDVFDTTPPLITDVRSEPATPLPSGQKLPFCEKDQVRVSARVTDLSKLAGVELWCSRDCKEMKPAHQMTFDGEFYTAAVTAGLCCETTAQDAAPSGNRATIRVPVVACQQVPTPAVKTPTWTPTPRPTRTRTSTPSPTRTLKPTLSPTRTRTPTPTRTRTPTRSPKPTRQELPAPGIVKPKNNVTFGCPPPKIILDWTAPSDPSRIANYRVRLQVRTTVTDWDDKKIWDPITATQVTATGEVTCGGVYRWRVVARDKAGNDGDVSDWAYFGIVIN